MLILKKSESDITCGFHQCPPPNRPSLCALSFSLSFLILPSKQLARVCQTWIILKTCLDPFRSAGVAILVHRTLKNIAMESS